MSALLFCQFSVSIEEYSITQALQPMIAKNQKGNFKKSVLSGKV